MRLQHCYFAHINNAQIVQVSKLVNRRKLSGVDSRNSNYDWFFSDSEIDNAEKNEPDINNLASFNKILESIKDLSDTCIKIKYIKIIKHKAMTLIVQKSEDIYIDFLNPYNPPSIIRKRYISFLLDEYI